MKSTKKTELRYEIQPGSQEQLLKTAAGMFTDYQIRQAIGELHSAELTEPEKAAYDSAMRYLQRSFDAGHSQAETPLVQSVEESSIEFQDSNNAINPYW